MNALKAKSESRINKHPDFQLVLENAARLKKNRDDKEYSLNFETFDKEMDDREKEAEKFKNLWDDPIPGLSAINMDIDQEFIQADSSRIARNDVWIKDLKKDIYLDEALNILGDMIQQSPSLGSIEKKK